MEVKVLVDHHPLALPKDISKAKKTAQNFAAQLQLEAKEYNKNISAVQVTWTPEGKFGGILVTKKPKHKKLDNQENVEPTGSLKLKISKKRFSDQYYSIWHGNLQ